MFLLLNTPFSKNKILEIPILAASYEALRDFTRWDGFFGQFRSKLLGNAHFIIIEQQ